MRNFQRAKFGHTICDPGIDLAPRAQVPAAERFLGNLGMPKRRWSSMLDRGCMHPANFMK
jgi:hypothetical protein